MFRTQKVNLQNFFRQKRTLYFSAVILLVLVSSILYQLRSRTSENMLAGLKELETQANSQIRDAQNLSEINIVLARSQLLAEKDDFLKAADQKFPGWQNSKEPPNPQIQKIANALNSQIQALSKSYKLTDLPIFYDFKILKSEAKISATTFYDGKLLALDSNLGTIFSLKTDNKNGAIVTTQDRFKNSSKIDLSGDQIETLLSNSVSGYPKNVAINKSESWGNMVSMRMFAGNVYLLDKDKNMIWKYMSSESGFSEIKQYLASGLSINFSKAVDLAIDGDVYVLTESGSVTKFTGGLPQDFGLKGLVDPLVKPTAIFTTDITQNIYILDNNRVVVVDKKGNYQSQYVLAASPSPLAPTIGADEAIKKIFLFSGSKVFGIEIK